MLIRSWAEHVPTEEMYSMCEDSDKPVHLQSILLVKWHALHLISLYRKKVTYGESFRFDPNVVTKVTPI